MIQTFTLADLRFDTQRRLNEPIGGSDMWSNDELDNYVNTAILRVYMDCRPVKTDVSISVQANIGIVGIPSNSLVPEFIYGSTLWGTQRLFGTTLLGLDKMAQGQDIWELDAIGQSRNFVPFSFDKLFLYPAPNASTNVVLHCTPYPTTLVEDADTVTLPKSGMRAVVPFAAYLAQMKNDVTKALGFLTEYKSVIAPVQEQIRNNEKYRPSVMAPARNFDRRNANPEVGRISTIQGYR